MTTDFDQKFIHLKSHWSGVVYEGAERIQSMQEGSQYFADNSKSVSEIMQDSYKIRGGLQRFKKGLGRIGPLSLLFRPPSYWGYLESILEKNQRVLQDNALDPKPQRDIDILKILHYMLTEFFSGISVELRDALIDSIDDRANENDLENADRFILKAMHITWFLHRMFEDDLRKMSDLDAEPIDPPEFMVKYDDYLSNQL